LQRQRRQLELAFKKQVVVNKQGFNNPKFNTQQVLSQITAVQKPTNRKGRSRGERRNTAARRSGERETTRSCTQLLFSTDEIKSHQLAELQLISEVLKPLIHASQRKMTLPNISRAKPPK
jgi:hypothetical protein